MRPVIAFLLAVVVCAGCAQSPDDPKALAHYRAKPQDIGGVCLEPIANDGSVIGKPCPALGSSPEFSAISSGTNQQTHSETCQEMVARVSRQSGITLSVLCAKPQQP